MILVAGLGNPGKKYTKTRHNIGFRIIDALEKSIKSDSEKEIVLFKPDTYMNESGKAIKKVLAYYKIPAENLIVIHDDSDLPFGKIRVSKNFSSAGHKGVQSIIDELKTKKFTRIRIGIRPLPTQENSDKKALDLVLKNFSRKEEKEIQEITKKAIEEINALLSSRS